MQALTERFEVRLPTQTLQMLRQETQWRGVPAAQLARETIALLLKDDDRQARLRADKALFQVEAPVVEWEKIKQEIEAAHLESAT